MSLGRKRVFGEYPGRRCESAAEWPAIRPSLIAGLGTCADEAVSGPVRACRILSEGCELFPDRRDPGFGVGAFGAFVFDHLGGRRLHETFVR